MDCRTQFKERQARPGGSGDYSDLSRGCSRPRRRAVRRLRRLGRAGGARRGRRRRQLRARVRARGGQRGGLATSRPAMVERGRARTARRATTWSGSRPTPRSCRSRTPASTASARCSARSSRRGPRSWPRELFRVVRPGQHRGHDGLDAGQLHRRALRRWRGATRRRPPTVPLPEQWGDEDDRRGRASTAWPPRRDRAPHDRLGGRVPRGVRRASCGAHAPMQVAARETSPPSSFDELHARLPRARAGAATADDGTVRIEAEYLVIVARKRG